MREQTAFAFELKHAADAGTFTGLASVYGNKDLGGDVVERGAFTKTLQERGTDVPILWQHDQRNPIGLGTLTDGYDGLTIKGRLDLNTDEGTRAYSGLRAGYLKGLSIGYDVVKQKYDRDARRLTELKLYEVSIVTFPMNESAQIQSVKRRLAGKEGRRLSAATRDAISEAIGHIERAHAEHRKGHRAALESLEQLLEGGGDEAIAVQNGEDEKAMSDFLRAHVERMKALFAPEPCRSRRASRHRRRMRWNARSSLRCLAGTARLCATTTTARTSSAVSGTYAPRTELAAVNDIDGRAKSVTIALSIYRTALYANAAAAISADAFDRRAADALDELLRWLRSFRGAVRRPNPTTFH